MVNIKNLTSLDLVENKIEQDIDEPQVQAEDLLQKRFEKLKRDTFENISNLKFKVYLNIFTSKNNVSWVITDVTRKQIYYKVSGGYSTKKGYLRNSQKVSSKNLDTIMEVLSNIKADYVFCTIKSAFGTKKHLPTTRSIIKLIESLKINKFKVFDHIINTTARNVSYTRPQGGKKGRR